MCVALFLVVCCFVLFYYTDIGESLRSRGHSFRQGTWGDRILTLHLNYVADYTGPLLSLFERTHNYSVDNQGLLPWRFRRVGRVCVTLFYYTDIGESLRSRGQFLTAVDLGLPDPHPSP